MDYSYISEQPDALKLQSEIEADPTISGGSHTVDAVTWSSPDDLIVSMSGTLSGAEQAALAAVVAAHDTLTYYKAQVFKLIDAETVRRIRQGFEYPPASGKFFSLDIESQVNWLGLYTFKALMSYPFDVRTQDDLDYITLTAAVDVDPPVLTAIGIVNTHLTGGRAVKAAALAAADKAAVDAAAASWLAGS